MIVTTPLHVAINVSDLDQAQWFYGDVLGLPQAERSLGFPGVWYQLGHFQIHLIVAQGHQYQMHNPDKWGRNGHLALAVADLEMAKAALVEAGCPVQASASGRAALFTQDPDGNIIELSAV
ncbi:VOC family protein [Nodosilinea sp. P-1105]|uniref:VOC family protein n=1 Tax=Nodosilinea sp. P-1105 TaxID=2546229 RepID=UPI00146ABE91|nr:VOC family protein [Nodosilinea sp. P-1105]NMF82425.1 glyoxalase [Nodosilinea sp. P-1105]